MFSRILFPTLLTASLAFASTNSLDTSSSKNNTKSIHSNLETGIPHIFILEKSSSQPSVDGILYEGMTKEQFKNNLTYAFNDTFYDMFILNVQTITTDKTKKYLTSAFEKYNLLKSENAEIWGKFFTNSFVGASIYTAKAYFWDESDSRNKLKGSLFKTIKNFSLEIFTRIAGDFSYKTIVNELICKNSNLCVATKTIFLVASSDLFRFELNAETPKFMTNTTMFDIDNSYIAKDEAKAIWKNFVTRWKVQTFFSYSSLLITTDPKNVEPLSWKSYVGKNAIDLLAYSHFSASGDKIVGITTYITRAISFAASEFLAKVVVPKVLSQISFKKAKVD